MEADSGKNGAMDSSFRPGTELLRHLVPGAPEHQAPDLLNSTGQQDTSMSLRAKWTLGGIIAGSAAAALLGAGSSALALYFARRVLTPARARVADQEVLAVIRDGRGQQVILAATPETIQDGVYSLFFDGGNGHARIGRILSYSPSERTVLREVEAVYQGNLKTARRGWWGGAAYPDPSAVGLASEEVAIEVEGGTAPAWLIPADPAADVWAVMVHGRGATRQESLRAARAVHELGLPSLLVSYRNDGLAPSAPDGRYGLGSTEWRDVDAAIAFALARGAKEVVLLGWSMGGAICLQTADLSKHRHVIRAMVLDAPVIDWVNVLAHHAELNRIPSAVGRYGQLMMGHRLGRRLTGLAAPVDLKSMDWVSRAVDLRTPTLIVHSVDDEYVPYGPSALLAEKNPEMVTFEAFEKARHAKEWNADPVRWESLVKAWLQQQLAPRRNPGQASSDDDPDENPGPEADNALHD